MDPKTLTRLSMKLSWLLRHGAAEAGVPMDAAGWVPEAAEPCTKAAQAQRGSLERLFGHPAAQ